MTAEEQYKKFEELDKLASQGGGVERVEKQHANGHMTARERIDMLLDKGTFNEIDKFVVHHCSDFGMDKKHIPGDGIVCGYGKIDGRLVYVYAYDFTVFGGTLSTTGAKKDCEGAGTGFEERRSGHRSERFGRRTHSGRCRQHFRICFHFLSEHHCLGCHSADFGHSRTVCGRRMLFSGPDRLHFHGEGKEPHVHYRPGCGKGRDTRRSRQRGTGHVIRTAAKAA